MKKIGISFILISALQLNSNSQNIYKSAHFLIGKSKDQIINAKGTAYELTNGGDLTYVLTP